jgi:hypothetical protein
MIKEMHHPAACTAAIPSAVHLDGLRIVRGPAVGAEKFAIARDRCRDAQRLAIVYTPVAVVAQ